MACTCNLKAHIQFIEIVCVDSTQTISINCMCAITSQMMIHVLTADEKLYNFSYSRQAHKQLFLNTPTCS